ncbi:MAG: hypothetical protein ACYSVY_24530 [Planctomycetota bacterium]
MITEVYDISGKVGLWAVPDTSGTVGFTAFYCGNFQWRAPNRRPIHGCLGNPLVARACSPRGALHEHIKTVKTESEGGVKDE